MATAREVAAQAGEPCYFLRLPLEVRHKIYRCLLLDSPTAFVHLFWGSDFSRKSGVIDGERHRESWEEHKKRLTTERQERKATQSEGGYNAGGHKVNVDDLPPLQSLALLQTDRQIHTEASDVLYSGLNVSINAYHFGFDDSETILGLKIQWRQPMIRYDYDITRPMDPHIFARFSRIRLKTTFQPDNIPTWLVHDDLHLNSHEDLELIKYFKGLRFFERFADLISQSLRITNLTISFNIRINARYTGWTGFRSQSAEDSDFDSELGYDTSEDGREAHEEKQKIVDARGMEILFDSDILIPLLQLSNVQKIEFEYSIYNCESTFIPQARHSSMLEKMKETIEQNWKTTHEAR